MDEFAHPRDKIVVTEWQLTVSHPSGAVVLHLAGIQIDDQGRPRSVLEAYEFPANHLKALLDDLAKTVQIVRGGQSRH